MQGGLPAFDQTDTRWMSILGYLVAHFAVGCCPLAAIGAPEDGRRRQVVSGSSVRWHVAAVLGFLSGHITRPCSHDAADISSLAYGYLIARVSRLMTNLAPCVQSFMGLSASGLLQSPLCVWNSGVGGLQLLDVRTRQDRRGS